MPTHLISGAPRFSRYIVLAFILFIVAFTFLRSPSRPSIHVPGSILGESGGANKPPTPPPTDTNQPSPPPPVDAKQPSPPPPIDAKQPSTPPLPATPATPSSDADKSAGAAAGTDWSRFAYFQYVTSEEHVCQSVMIFESLNRLGSKPDRLLLYPDTWKDEIEGGDEGKLSKIKKLLIMARKEYKVKLRPVKIQRLAAADPTWAAGFTKLLIFNQTDYSRVLGIDSDATVYKPMDELFLLPPVVVAMPRAYWLTDATKLVLSAQIFLVQPSAFEMSRITKAMETKGSKDYDMEILNNLYGTSCMILPHRPYNCLSGEFKKGLRKPHTAYLGSDTEPWKPKEVFEEVKYLHFSDWPVRKPWYRNSDATMKQVEPPCETPDHPDCVDRDIWRGLYADYAKRRKDICGLDLL